MKEKYMRVELGTEYCGETSVEYYKLADQNQTELTDADWERYQEMALDHNESFGHEYSDYCDENELDPEDGESWDAYAIECCEAGGIEIVEADLDNEINHTFNDGFIQNRKW